MLDIDKYIFTRSLIITQAYCSLQMNKGQTSKAQILRSYNPVYNDKPLFSFEDDTAGLTKWAMEPNEFLTNSLFEKQLVFKEKQPLQGKDKIYDGDIMVAQIDCSVIDGASEGESMGVIDGYDIPPIDSWFYLTKTKESRLLFAWIPKELRADAHGAILVNCVDCMGWFHEWYPRDYKRVIGEIRPDMISAGVGRRG